MNCAFCTASELEGRLIKETPLAMSFLTNAPIVPGHTLIAPKRHVTYYEDLTNEEKQSVEELRMSVHNALKETFGAEDFNYAWNEEKVGGQSVPHFHLHVLPRKEGDAGTYQYEPREFIYRPVPVDMRPESPAKELIDVAMLIRSALN